MSKNNSGLGYFEDADEASVCSSLTSKMYEINTLADLYAVLKTALNKNPELKEYKVHHVEFGGITKTNKVEIDPKDKRIIFFN